MTVSETVAESVQKVSLSIQGQQQPWILVVYGDFFWLEILDEHNLTQRSVPANTVHTVGHEGQFVTIVSSSDAVVVRLGKTRSADV